MEGVTTMARADLALVGAGQRVLVTEVDLFRSLGGGQTVLRRLMTLRPQDRFYYFLRHESPDAPRPANAVGIPFVPKYRAVQDGLPQDQAHLLWAYRDARNLAFSVAQHLPGHSFDVVDVPDYTQHGIFIRAALEAEGLRCDTVVLALHGSLSSALASGWPAPGAETVEVDEMRIREELQFRAADARYAISAPYAREWQATVPLPVNLVDPSILMGDVDPALSGLREGRPDLVFLGRREKCKGPDMFLDLAWCVDPSLYRRLLIVGPDGLNRLGVGSNRILAGMARLRRLQPEIVGGLARGAVLNMLAERTVLLLPSRRDTFNLVLLEALARGCPALISRNAGAAEWLLEKLPDLAWLVVDVDCARTAAAATADVLRHYDARRAELVAAVRQLEPPRLDAFDDIYRPAPQVDLDGRQTVVELAARFGTLVRLEQRSRLRQAVVQPLVPMRRVGRAIAPFLPPIVRRRLERAGPLGHSLITRAFALYQLRHGGLRREAKEALRQAIQRASKVSARTFRQIDCSRRLEGLRHDMLGAPETDFAEQRAKLRRLSNRVVDHLVNRVPLFREMARLERALGRDLVAATYLLRVMRWVGRDSYGDLPFVRATLQAQGFNDEAATAEAMFGPAEERDARCLDLMQSSFQRNRRKPDLPLEVLDDRRGPAPRRVAVIVSLYNAASKLPTLLACLAQQSLAARGELEVVLVDSNSPTDERAALEGFLARQDLPVVYARSAARETIQQAWNRGIGLTQAPYLAFLGADEGLHPDALHTLAAALDAEPGADWAMADSLVTNVDAMGVYDGDIMPYDRTGYRQDLVYLDTCYLSWVGGLYRRSIHDRFGFYDESFRAAGDTEFKSRILPHIHSVRVPRMLGVFNNYPEERTTAHPRAEIEDLRAWYLWRTPAGMRHAFANRPAEDAMALLRTALNYRKSFCGHWSSDFDLADAIARSLAGRPDVPAASAQQAAQATGAALATLRQLDQLPRSLSSGPRGLNHARYVFAQVKAAHGSMAEQHRVLFNLPARPHYEVFNDNRYEQHWWSWSGA